MDADHFRQRAAHARELAQFGDDMRLSSMLLEVAIDLDAEAAAIEAQETSEQSKPENHLAGRLLNAAWPETAMTSGPVTAVPVSGAIAHADRPQTAGSKVTLEQLGHVLRLSGTTGGVLDSEAAGVFDRTSSADPASTRVMRSQLVSEQV